MCISSALKGALTIWLNKFAAKMAKRFRTSRFTCGQPRNFQTETQSPLSIDLTGRTKQEHTPSLFIELVGSLMMESLVRDVAAAVSLAGFIIMVLVWSDALLIA